MRIKGLFDFLTQIYNKKNRDIIDLQLFLYPLANMSGYSSPSFSMSVMYPFCSSARGVVNQSCILENKL